MLEADELDAAMQAEFDGPDLADIATAWRSNVAALVADATLVLPQDAGMARGGKAGRHTEHFGFLLAEMQYLQRSYPGATW
jgi:ring-1,2-phenylacetyl-CoA epoxidase subunit PaaC